MKLKQMLKSIFRNNISAENFCEDNPNFLTYSIPEVKGLEFELVILYNFFKDSNIKKLWINVLFLFTGKDAF